MHCAARLVNMLNSFANEFANSDESIARGSGWQKLGAYMNLGAYYVCGIPIAVMLGIRFELRGKGLWIGILVGAFCQVHLLFLIISFTHWKKLTTREEAKLHRIEEEYQRKKRVSLDPTIENETSSQNIMFGKGQPSSLASVCFLLTSVMMEDASVCLKSTEVTKQHLKLLGPGNDDLVRAQAAGALKYLSSQCKEAMREIANSNGIHALINATIAPSIEIMLGEYAQARDNLERVLDCLDRDKRETFEDSVTWARLKFEDYFANWERQLAFTFPEDSATCTGAPFWSAPKIFSRPLQFSTSDLGHLHFVMVAAILAESSVLVVLYPLVKESFQLYADICEVVAVFLDKFFDMEYTDCVKAFDAYASSGKPIEELVTFYNWCSDVIFRFSNTKELADFFSITFELMSPNHSTYPGFPTQKVILEAECHSEFLHLDSYIFMDQIFKKVICSSHATVLLLDTHYGSNIRGWILFVMVVPFKQWDPK